ncbi:MAG: hypothetical protein J0L78_11945 [Planctomycetes bacterium]|nr:hypothetical protein [Planctomycetota bacterium]
MKNMLMGCVVACGLAVSVAPSALASTLIVPCALTGTYNAAGGYSNTPGFQNYRVGLSPITTTPEHRNFFNFDLTSYAPLPPMSVASAKLKLYLPKFAPPDLLDPGMGYISPDMSEHYVVTSTPYSTAALGAAHTTAEAMAIFATLGTGIPVGDIVVTPMDMGSILEIDMSPMTLGYLNATMGVGTVAFGGRIESFDGTHIDELLFAFTDLWMPHMLGKEPVLEITLVPGAGGVLSLMGVGVVVGVRRRR